MASLTLTITSRSGGKKEFSEVLGKESTVMSISKLHKAVKKVQEESNAALTVMVNAEKAQNGISQNKDVVTEGCESDGTGEDENDDSGDEPQEKKVKS